MYLSMPKMNSAKLVGRASNDEAAYVGNSSMEDDQFSEIQFYIRKVRKAVVVSMDEDIIHNAMKALAEYAEQSLVCRVYCEQRFARWCENFLTQDPDLFLIDQESCDSQACLSYIKNSMPNARIIVFSNEHEGLKLNEFAAAGVHGILMRDESNDVVSKAVRALLAGHYYLSDKVVKGLYVNHVLNLNGLQKENNHRFNRAGLTPREIETITSLSHALTYQEVANKMFVTLSTVQAHVRAIYRKLGANSKTQAVLKAKSIGII